jgi:hypothetical protein
MGCGTLETHGPESIYVATSTGLKPNKCWALIVTLRAVTSQALAPIATHLPAVVHNRYDTISDSEIVTYKVNGNTNWVSYMTDYYSLGKVSDECKDQIAAYIMSGVLYDIVDDYKNKYQKEISNLFEDSFGEVDVKCPDNIKLYCDDGFVSRIDGMTFYFKDEEGFYNAISDEFDLTRDDIKIKEQLSTLASTRRALKDGVQKSSELLRSIRDKIVAISEKIKSRINKWNEKRKKKNKSSFNWC